MLESMIGFVEALHPEYFIIMSFAALIAMAVVTRHGGDAGDRRALRWLSIVGLCHLALVALGGAANALNHSTAMFKAEIRRAIVEGHRLDAAPITDFGFMAVLSRILGDMGSSFVANPIGAASAYVMIFGGAVAGAVHVWRGTQNDLPPIKWLHAFAGALAVAAVWMGGIYFAAGRLESAQREGLARTAALQTKNCPDLSTPCPLQRKPDGG